MIQLQSLAQPIIDIQNQMAEALKPVVKLTTVIQEMMKPLGNIAKLMAQLSTQLKQNFIDTISIIEPPETYDSSKIQLHEGIHKMALNMVVFVDELDKHPFHYLKERMLLGINAHLEKNYVLSLFCIFSVIDGMLSWFYVQNHQGQKIPDINMKLTEFFGAYDFEHVVGKKEIRPKFEDFFKHRNEIMHGGEHSHFDENLSIAALLFLGIVYYSLTEKK